MKNERKIEKKMYKTTETCGHIKYTNISVMQVPTEEEKETKKYLKI